MKSQKILFIDRDGTLVKEPPIDYQLDSLEKLSFVPGVMKSLGFIAEKLDFFFAMVTNQDGLGTAAFPENSFWPAHHLMMETLEGEGITWDAVHIDPTMPEDNASTRKPGTAMLTEYIDNPKFDLAGSFVIGDRITDMQLAKNLGCKGIFLISDDRTREQAMQEVEESALEDVVALVAMNWVEIVPFLFAGERTARCQRVTKETAIDVAINLDGQGKSLISTGLHFFDHMLEQIAKHGGVTLNVAVKGDLEVDEHHTIEDTAIALGTCLKEALGDKRGIERYGYSLPMDDSQAHVLLDFGGRPWLIWDADFKREYVGDMPTEMFLHFFKSLSDAALMNVNIRAEGQNEHHKIEGIFKAFARAIKMAIRRDIYRFELPSTKGVL